MRKHDFFLIFPLARHEGFSRLLDVKLIHPQRRTYVGQTDNLRLSYQSMRDFNSCKLVYITCATYGS